MTEAAPPLLDEPPATADPGPSWCAVANVVKEHPFGPGGAEIRRGTKYFVSGTKVCLVAGYWRMGGEKVTVVGRRRATHRLITIDMPSRLLCNWRTELVRNPHVTRVLTDRGEYTRWGSNAPGSEAAKDRANAVVASFTQWCSSVGPPCPATPGPYPEAAKKLALAYGPLGTWTAMPPAPGNRPGPVEARFSSSGQDSIKEGNANGHRVIRFASCMVAPGLIRVRTMNPEEPRWYRNPDSPPYGPEWSDVAYEFRLIVTPTAAFEALAEPGRDGFWLSPTPLLWAGPPFRLAP